MREANVKKINEAPQQGIGMDVIIVSTGNIKQETFWQERLQQMQGYLTKPGAILVAVEEDWPGGAGNALGTFYAYNKARDKVRALHGVDIADMQKEGAAIAIYHTAGQGMRLFPLTASECGNKPAVKLPGLVGPVEAAKLITMLEAVIKQTAIYAPSRMGRLSVFWGDQIFIPSTGCDYTPRGHIDILTKRCLLPDAKQWKEQGLGNYGLITVDGKKEALYLEKVTCEAFAQLCQEGKIFPEKDIGISMGSFSLSTAMTFALLDLFEPELLQHTLKMDVEPFIWMASTLDLNTYIQQMDLRGYPKEKSQSHHARLQAFKHAFCKQHPELTFFDVVDIGADSCWWDFGNIGAYYTNLMKLTGADAEAQLMHSFFNTKSCLLNCDVKEGSIKNSVVVNVKADYMDVSDCVIINSSFHKVKADRCLFYNVSEEEDLAPEPRTIRADAPLPVDKEHLKLYTHLDRDGKADWNIRLPTNALSYAELHKLYNNPF